MTKARRAVKKPVSPWVKGILITEAAVILLCVFIILGQLLARWT